MTHAGEFLRNYGKTHGLTQKDMARRMKLTESHMSQVINGRRKQIEEGTLAGILDELAKNDAIAPFLAAYLKDILPRRHTHFATAAATGVGKEDARPPSTSPYDLLIEAVQTHPAPEKIATMLAGIVRAAANNKGILDTLKGLSLVAAPR